MDTQSRHRPAAGGRHLRLQTLTRLRWLAVAGQSLTVLGVRFGLGFTLPLAWCFALIALSAWLNIFVGIRYAASVRLVPRPAALLLAYDAAQLSGLLYLTGGLENPFAVLLLVPVMVSASTLPAVHTLTLALCVVGVATGLAFFHLPLPWQDGAPLPLPLTYIAGMWCALVASLAFMAFYAWRIAEEARQMSNALAATEMVLAREQRLTALDGLAAAAAHELGTPLATMSLVAKELLRQAAPEDPNIEDLTLLKAQSERCRDILAKLTSLGETPDAHFARLPLSSLIEEVVEPHRSFGVTISVEMDSGEREPVGWRNPAILYGLGNLIENAVDFARSEAKVTAAWDAHSVTIAITDDGPGFAPEIMSKLGEPYVTTRAIDQDRGDGDEFGLGLGFFIAKTLLERSGAVVCLANRAAPASGAVVSVVWPRQAMEQGPQSAAGQA